MAIAVPLEDNVVDFILKLLTQDRKEFGKSIKLDVRHSRHTETDGRQVDSPI